MMMYQYFASCPLYFEDLLEDEVIELGASEIKRVVSGLYFSGDDALLYRAAINLRTASSVRLVLSHFRAANREELYHHVMQVPWVDHFTADHSFACHATKSRKTFAPENFLALVVKDAIADTFLKLGRRPNVDTTNPDLFIALHAEGEECMLSLELGRALFKRGYREGVTEDNGLLIKAHQAPLKENLAAALLLRADWPRFADEGLPLVDLMCGTGTFLSEGYMIAAKRAPNLGRPSFGFERWLGFKPSLLAGEMIKAAKCYEAGRLKELPAIYGYDILGSAVKQSLWAAKAVGAQDFITVIQADATQVVAPAPSGLIVTNPPYGDRLLTPSAAADLYRALSVNLKEHFRAWEVALLIPNEGIIKHLDIRVRRTNSFFNGAEKRFFARFSLDEVAREQQALTESALQLHNRLEKRFELLSGIANREWKTNSYRLYDADLPEYNAACDIYGNNIIIQEYAAPSELPLDVAKNRLKELIRVVHEVTAVPKVHIFLKQRRRTKPTSQYEKESIEGVECIVSENNLQFYVNLNEYLDSGLYLDHRPLRRIIYEKSATKCFLNLFGYTGSVSVAAAAGGAAITCTVDSSKTYLAIAKENMILNGFTGDNYTFIRSDVRSYINSSRHKWDIIYCDPPTFSNSKMRDEFDIQRDHSSLIIDCMAMLKNDGEFYFSTHFRRFKLDEQLFSYYKVEDYTARSLDEDFRRYPIHKMWRFREKD